MWVLYIGDKIRNINTYGNHHFYSSWTSFLRERISYLDSHAQAETSTMGQEVNDSMGFMPSRYCPSLVAIKILPLYGPLWDYEWDIVFFMVRQAGIIWRKKSIQKMKVITMPMPVRLLHMCTVTRNWAWREGVFFTYHEICWNFSVFL